MKKRFLSTLMALCLALSLLPTAAFAAEGGTQLPTAVNGVITLDEKCDAFWSVATYGICNLRFERLYTVLGEGECAGRRYRNYYR